MDELEELAHLLDDDEDVLADGAPGEGGLDVAGVLVAVADDECLGGRSCPSATASSAFEPLSRPNPYLRPLSTRSRTTSRAGLP